MTTWRNDHHLTDVSIAEQVKRVAEARMAWAAAEQEALTAKNSATRAQETYQAAARELRVQIHCVIGGDEWQDMPATPPREGTP